MFLFYFFSHPFPLKRILITIDKTSNNLTNTRYTIDIYVNPESFGRLEHASKMVSRYQFNIPQPTTGLKADKMSNKY